MYLQMRLCFQVDKTKAVQRNKGKVFKDETRNKMVKEVKQGYTRISLSLRL